MLRGGNVRCEVVEKISGAHPNVAALEAERESRLGEVEDDGMNVIALQDLPQHEL